MCAIAAFLAAGQSANGGQIDAINFAVTGLKRLGSFGNKGIGIAYANTHNGEIHFKLSRKSGNAFDFDDHLKKEHAEERAKRRNNHLWHKDSGFFHCNLVVGHALHVSDSTVVTDSIIQPRVSEKHSCYSAVVGEISNAEDLYERVPKQSGVLKMSDALLLAMLTEYYMKSGKTLFQASIAATSLCRGDFSAVMVSPDFSDSMVLVKGSDSQDSTRLFFGKNQDGCFVASHESVLIDYVKKYDSLNNRKGILLRRGGGKSIKVNIPIS